MGLLGSRIQQALLHVDKRVDSVACHVGYGTRNRRKAHPFLHSIRYQRSLARSQAQQDLPRGSEALHTLVSDFGDRGARTDPGFAQAFPRHSDDQRILPGSEI